MLNSDTQREKENAEELAPVISNYLLGYVLYQVTLLVRFVFVFCSGRCWKVPIRLYARNHGSRLLYLQW